MAHKYCMEALDLVFGGDFRQILPVIKKGSRSEITGTSLKKSYLWDHLTHIKLSQNMRLMWSNTSQPERQEIAAFDSWLKEIGDGVGCSLLGEANIVIPADLMVQKHIDPIQDIVRATYPDLLQNYKNVAYLAGRVVLAPHHDMVHKVNAHMLSQIPGEEITYLSSDYIDIGVPIILLRNIDQSAGLCNGTRMVVKLLGKWFIEAQIISGSNLGRQYPIAICFAMTINKSQGQTLQQVGLCLQHQVFSHGQLYVALSRVTTRLGLKILSCDSDGNHLKTMQNIVYKEILA
ncbi:ATP-dependent DNA helicase PIF1 [Linum perenne]